jgi:hypothetical protein
MRAFLVLGVMMCPTWAMADTCMAPSGAAAGAELVPRAAALAWNVGEREDMSVDAVLAREAFTRCQRSRLAVASGYQKQTEFDNTPYRFNMKPGQKLSAAEFDAWMASRGIRIVRAKVDANAPAAAPVPAAAHAPVVAD